MSFSVLIMAAGASRRFAGCKLLAEVEPGLLMLERTVQLATELEPDYLALVTGAWHAEISTAQQQGRLTPQPLIYIPDWAEGLGCSIAKAVEQLPAETDRLLILLADQVALELKDLQSLLTLSAESDAVCAFYAGRRGVPALFRRSLFPALKALEGDQGAKQLLCNQSLSIAELAMPNAALDIDTREALQRFTG